MGERERAPPAVRPRVGGLRVWLVVRFRTAGVLQRVTGRSNDLGGRGCMTGDGTKDCRVAGDKPLSSDSGGDCTSVMIRRM